LTREGAHLAAERRYDEPFVVEAGDRERLFAALRGKGFNVIRGDRFQHLTGGHSKGDGVRLLLDLYRRRDGAIVSIGLGNSANDLPFLSVVDRPILVRNPDGSYDSEVTAKIPEIERTSGIGPRGWNEIVSGILAEAQDRS
jgi:mannosyl-3-phosphoglycerate phosphatase